MKNVHHLVRKISRIRAEIEQVENDIPKDHIHAHSIKVDLMWVMTYLKMAKNSLEDGQ